MPDLLTTAQLAEYLRLKPQTLQAQRSRGVGFPYIRIGRNVRYRRTDVEKHIRECLVVPGEDSPTLEPRHPSMKGLVEKCREASENGFNLWERA